VTSVAPRQVLHWRRTSRRIWGGLVGGSLNLVRYLGVLEWWPASSDRPWRCLHGCWRALFFGDFCHCYKWCCDLLHVCILFCCVSMGKVLQWFLYVATKRLLQRLPTCSCNIGLVTHMLDVFFLLLILRFCSKQISIFHYIWYFLRHGACLKCCKKITISTYFKTKFQKILHSKKLLHKIAKLIRRWPLPPSS
jgi:hypothetical protein